MDIQKQSFWNYFKWLNNPHHNTQIECRDIKTEQYSTVCLKNIVRHEVRRVEKKITEAKIYSVASTEAQNKETGNQKQDII